MKKNFFLKFIIILLSLIWLIIFFVIYRKKINGDILNYPPFQIDEYKDYFDKINLNNFSHFYWCKYKIENIFLLITILPFLKTEVYITNNLYIRNLFKNISKLNDNEMIIIKKKSTIDISKRCRQIFFYNWEYLPSKNKTNYIRHILYHYYTEDCLKEYEDSLNMNIKNYIELKKDNLDHNQIKDLLSKN